MSNLSAFATIDFYSILYSVVVGIKLFFPETEIALHFCQKTECLLSEMIFILNLQTCYATTTRVGKHPRRFE